MPLKHNIKKVELKNGAKGIIVDSPESSVFCYEINFRAGNRYVKSPEIQQTAHLLEHLAFNGTKEYPTPEKFSQIFTENGAYNNASTYEMGISYFGGSADFEAERILDLQGKAICQPNFDEETLEKEKKTVREELTGQATNYYRLLWSNLVKSMNPNIFTDAEKIETIDKISLDDITEHHQRTHTTKNMRFVLGGDLNNKKLNHMLAQIEAFELPLGRCFEIEKSKFKKAEGPIRIYNKQVNNLYFYLIMNLNRKLGVREEYVLRALNHVLTATFHSRIFGKARQQGICYAVTSGGGYSVDDTSEFFFASQVTPENSLKLYDLIITELNKIVKEGITEEELSAIKRYSFGEFQQVGQTVGALVGYYSSYFYEDDIVELKEVSEIINSIKKEEIKDLASEFINSGIWGFGELGNITEAKNKKAYNKFAKELFKEK